MSEVKFAAPRSRMEETVCRAFLALNTGLFVWAVVARLRWGDAPDHSTGFVLVTGSMFAQSLRDFVRSTRIRWGLLIGAGALLVGALALITKRA